MGSADIYPASKRHFLCREVNKAEIARRVKLRHLVGSPGAHWLNCSFDLPSQRYSDVGQSVPAGLHRSRIMPVVGRQSLPFETGSAIRF
jgi:hypothetical protein